MVEFYSLLNLNRGLLALYRRNLGRKAGGPLSKHQPIRFSLSVENERADAGRDGRTCLARPNSQARTGTGKFHFPCSVDRKRVFSSHSFWTSMDVPAGVIQEEGHRISHPPSFGGACLNFSREKDSAIPFPRRP